MSKCQVYTTFYQFDFGTEKDSPSKFGTEKDSPSKLIFLDTQNGGHQP